MSFPHYSAFSECSAVVSHWKSQLALSFSTPYFSQICLSHRVTRECTAAVVCMCRLGLVSLLLSKTVFVACCFLFLPNPNTWATCSSLNMFCSMVLYESWFCRFSCISCLNGKEPCFSILASPFSAIIQHRLVNYSPLNIEQIISFFQCHCVCTAYVSSLSSDKREWSTSLKVLQCCPVGNISS